MQTRVDNDAATIIDSDDLLDRAHPVDLFWRYGLRDSVARDTDCVRSASWVTRTGKARECVGRGRVVGTRILLWTMVNDQCIHTDVRFASTNAMRDVLEYLEDVLRGRKLLQID